jgi:hypothetical protein
MNSYSHQIFYVCDLWNDNHFKGFIEVRIGWWSKQMRRTDTSHNSMLNVGERTQRSHKNNQGGRRRQCGYSRGYMHSTLIRDNGTLFCDERLINPSLQSDSFFFFSKMTSGAAPKPQVAPPIWNQRYRTALKWCWKSTSLSNNVIETFWDKWHRLR